MKIIRLDPQTLQPAADSWTLSRSRRSLSIGRQPPADVLLDSPSVSPLHAELSWQAGYLSVRDLASINGVFLRGSRVLRAPLRDQDVFSVGGISFRVSDEPSDALARRNRRLAALALVVGLAVLAAFVLAFLRDARNSAPESPPQDPAPLAPPVADVAFQSMSDQCARASELLDEARRIVADGLDDLRAASLLEQSLALNPSLSQSSLLLKGLRDKNSPAIRRQVDRLAADGQFQNALDLVQAQQPLLGSPADVASVRNAISQRVQLQSAIDALDDGDLDLAQSILDSISQDLVPEKADALSRLAKAREALAWTQKIDRLADRGNLDSVLRLADDEPLHAPYLSADDLDEVRGAIARARALDDVKTLVEAHNPYALMRYVENLPNASRRLRPLREILAPEADALLRAADAQSALAQSTPVPADLPDALASYSAAKALAALYVVEPSPDLLRRFRRHSDRWSAYLASVAARARAYADRGARAEARAVLQPLLPHLDDYDPAAIPLRTLSVQLAPLSLTPENLNLLDRPSPAQ